jgi:rhodanese-related sulfurtransferase
MTIKTIDVLDTEEVAELIARGDVTLVEALPPAYWQKERLPGAINIPHDQVDELAPGLLPDLDATIVVYCANEPCPNSGLAARRLGRLGYTRVFDYAGGKQAWLESGRPFVS